MVLSGSKMLVLSVHQFWLHCTTSSTGNKSRDFSLVHKSMEASNDSMHLMLRFKPCSSVLQVAPKY